MIYDALNRVTGKTYTYDTANVTYCYDGAVTNALGQCQTRVPAIANAKGRLTEVYTPLSATRHEGYDGLGRVTRSVQKTEEVEYGFGYQYQAAGLVGMAYPSGRSVSTSYDQAGRVSAVGAWATSVSYAPPGAPAQVTLGNGLVESWTYNARLQTQTITASKGSTLLGLTYGYPAAGNNGNVQSQSIARPSFTATQSYGHDAVNRLSSASEGAEYRSFDYSATGNGWVTTASAGWAPGSFTPRSASWYDGSNRLVNAGPGVQYDAAGNQKAMGGYTFGYDAEGRQSSSGLNGVTTAYGYDGEGKRVKKGGMVLVYDAFGRLAAEYGGQVIAGEAGARYLTADHLGSMRLVTDAAGEVKQCRDYLPFGEELGAGVGGRPACYAAANEPRAKFTGKERDGETGLDYFLARYYSGAQGRFTSPDEFVGGPYEVGSSRPEKPGPLPYADITNPQSLNKYAYALNNPLRYIDPDGHEIALAGSTQDKEEEKRRLLANASKKGEAALFNTVTDKNGKTTLVLDKAAAAQFTGSHSKGFNMLVQTINSKNTVTVLMDNFDSRTTYQGANATVYLNRNVAGIDRVAPMRDAQGNLVPNPFNIIAGHEVLGHARLHLLGDPGAYFDGSGSKTFQIENQLRREQGLPPRPDDVP